MDFIFEFFDLLTNPDWIMDKGGLYLVLAILFLEAGIFLFFFLPGDPLLFISGIIIAGATESMHIFSNDVVNLLFWMLLFVVAASLGNFLGYFIGGKAGNYLMNRKKESWLIKKKHIKAAHDFYEKKGDFAIVIARFLPIVRTFAPFVGGMVEMKKRNFFLYTILGAIIWVGSITTAGYLLGENEWVKHNLEWIIMGIVLAVTLPTVINMIPKKSKN